jgi:hypothetical protein
MRSRRRLPERGILDRDTLRPRGTFPTVAPQDLLGLANALNKGELCRAIYLRLDRGDGGTRTRDFLLAKHALDRPLTCDAGE